MKVYTGTGDNGRTSLLAEVNVLKTDDRIELLGTVDELNSHLGLSKVLADGCLRKELEHIQRGLMRLMSGVADPMKKEYRFEEGEILLLEEWIDGMENAFSRPKDFVLYGGCELSARLDVARAVCRRAERRFRSVAQKYAVDKKALIYMNRLADYLYMRARYADYRAGHDKEEGIRQEVVRRILENGGK